MSFSWFPPIACLLLILLVRLYSMVPDRVFRPRPYPPASTLDATNAAPQLPEDQPSYFPTDLRDVYHTSFILRQKLPAELALQVLEAAGYWVRTASKRKKVAKVSEVAHFSGPNTFAPGHHYLSSEPIGFEGLSGLHPVRKIVFTITSKDQGWSSYPEDHGTTRNSWTWFEAVTRGRDPDPEHIAKSRRICTNVHAGKHCKTQVVTWTWDSDDQEEREWVQSLKRGQQVDILAFARFPGWVNVVANAKIEVFAAGVR